MHTNRTSRRAHSYFESLLGALINKGGCVHRFDVEVGLYNLHFKKKIVSMKDETSIYNIELQQNTPS
jgi:hypothetical protein